MVCVCCSGGVEGCGSCQTFTLYNDPCGTQGVAPGCIGNNLNTDQPCGCFSTPSIIIRSCSDYIFSGYNLPAEYDNCSCFTDTSVCERSSCNSEFEEGNPVAICNKTRNYLAYRTFVYVYDQNDCKWKRISESTAILSDGTVCSGYGDCDCPEIITCTPEQCPAELDATGCPCDNPLP